MKSQKNLIKVLCAVAEAPMTAGAGCGLSTQSLLDSLAISRDSSAETVVNARNFNAILKGCITDGVQSVLSFDQSRMRFDQGQEAPSTLPSSVDLKKVTKYLEGIFNGVVSIDDFQRSIHASSETVVNNTTNSSNGCSNEQPPPPAVSTASVPIATSTTTSPPIFSQTVIVGPSQGTPTYEAPQYTTALIPSGNPMVVGTTSNMPVCPLLVNSAPYPYQVNSAPYPNQSISAPYPNQGAAQTEVLITCGTYNNKMPSSRHHSRSPRHFSGSASSSFRSGGFNSNISSCGITDLSESSSNWSV